MRLNSRGIAVCAIALASAGWLGPQVPDLLHQLGGQPDFTTALGAGLALVHVGLCCWVLAVIALGLTGRLSRGTAITGLLFAVTVAAPAEAGVDGLMLPDRPVSVTAAQPIVVVQPGDSLWAIASGTGTADVPAAVRAWYRANRDVIGPDPDLILPGQKLRDPR